MCVEETPFYLKTSRETCLSIWRILKKDQDFTGRKNKQVYLKKPYNHILFYSPKFTYERSVIYKYLHI